MRVWRLTRERHASSAFSGIGAALYGQRWNGKGIYVVYCASSMALAQLEQLEHISRELAPVDLVSIAAVVPDDAIETVDVARLPPRWRDEPPPFELSAIGDRWVRTARSLALRVPSAVAPDDWNVLLNPAHERFGEIKIETPREVKLDPRLLG